MEQKMTKDTRDIQAASCAANDIGDASARKDEVLVNNASTDEKHLKDVSASPTIAAELAEALQFYQDGFMPVRAFRTIAGWNFRPTQILLNDCGNIAKEALAKYENTITHCGSDAVQEPESTGEGHGRMAVGGELEDWLRDIIKDDCGGHSMTNLNRDNLWFIRNPINLTKLSRAILAKYHGEPA